MLWKGQEKYTLYANDYLSFSICDREGQLRHGHKMNYF